jgi:hypothetical protein
MTAVARIKKLKIAAKGQQGVPTAQSVIEDAFRTQLSSVSVAVQKGVLVIRKMDLGVIRSRRDQLRINQLVLRYLQGMGEAIFHPNDPRAKDALAVIFSNPAEPYILLAKAITEGRKLENMWAYRAIFGDVISHSKPNTINALITHALQSPYGVLVVVDIIETLGDQAVVILAKCQSAELERLLGHLNISQSIGDASKITHHEQGEITKQLAALCSKTDLWIALRVAVSKLGLRHTIIDILIASAIIKHFARPTSSQEVNQFIDLLEHINVKKPNLWAATPNEILLSLNDFKAFYMDENFEQRYDETASKYPSLSNAEADLKKLEKPYIFNDKIKKKITEKSTNQIAETTEVSQNIAKLEKARLDTHSAETVNTPQIQVDQNDAELRFGDPTQFAGVSYLISLINQSFSKWLNDPLHLMAGTGKDILLSLMGECESDQNDPTWQFLKTLEVQVSNDPMMFWLPVQFLNSEKPKLCIHTVRGHRGWRAVTLAKTGVLVALWKMRAPSSFRAVIKDALLVRSSKPHEFDPHETVEVCTASLKEWLLEKTKLDLAKLVCRAGYIEVTNTHLDAVFNADFIDLNIRRWGMDVSPAWCPWLFRVITIHYDFGQRIGEYDA